MNSAQGIQGNGKAFTGPSSICLICKRVLRHPRSIAIGMGKTCGRKFPGTYERLAHEAEGQQSFIADSGRVKIPDDKDSGGET